EGEVHRPEEDDLPLALVGLVVDLGEGVRGPRVREKISDLLGSTRATVEAVAVLVPMNVCVRLLVPTNRRICFVRCFVSGWGSRLLGAYEVWVPCPSF
ncbi:hypothetical protein, partial [Kitasatospora sp. NPDC004289]